MRNMRILEWRTLFALALLMVALGDARLLRKREADGSSSSSSSSESSSEEGTATEVVNMTQDITDSVLDFIDSCVGFLEGIPLLGSLVGSMMGYVYGGIYGFEMLTNGFLGRLLGGAFPCTIDPKTGTNCQGISDNGGMGQVFMNALNVIPNFPMMGLFKKFIDLCIQLFGDPTMDVIFGGVPE